MLFLNKCEACGFWAVFKITVRHFKTHEPINGISSTGCTDKDFIFG
jgi:hypothetical protein